MQPIPLLSYLAAQVPGLYLGTSILLLPLHHPVEIAEQTATLDVLSGGRFLLGVGQGYRDVEFQPFGLEKRFRRQRLVEGLQVIRKLWAEERIKDGYERMYQLYRRWGQPGESYDLSFDELKQERLIVGSPDEVVEQVMAYHQEFGAELMWFTVYWPGMEPQWSLETIQLFGERVIPEIKRMTPRCPLP